MQKLFVAIALAAASLFLFGGDAETLDDFIEAELSASGFPGVAYTIVEDGEITSDARGVADLRSGKALTPDTPFAIGSISKSFTAIAILQLVEAGKLDLDGTLSAYLAPFEGRPSGEVTLRQLLGHASGYSTLQGNNNHAGSNDELSAQIERMASWPLAYTPGTKWDYSNANYILLGGVIEAVSGERYASYIEANILSSLGMTNSFVADGGTYPEMANGHTPWFGTKRPVKDAQTSAIIAPAGGVIASASDLALYLNMLLNGEDDIITAEHKALLMEPANPQFPFYGLGFSLSEQDGTVYHTGTSRGTETLALMIPDERKAVAVLVNSGSGLGFGETANLINGITAHALDWDFTPDQSSWGRKMLFLMFALMPLIFTAGMVQAWLGRSGLRAKTGAFGAVSLWFPLVMMVALAWVCVTLIPSLFGVTLKTLSLFSPDLGLVLLATAITGAIWAVMRLCVYYSPRVSGG